MFCDSFVFCVGFFSLLALCFSSTLNYFNFFVCFEVFVTTSSFSLSDQHGLLQSHQLHMNSCDLQKLLMKMLKNQQYFSHTANTPLCQISKTEHHQLMTDHLLKRVNGSDWSVDLALPFLLLLLPPIEVITLYLKVD